MDRAAFYAALRSRDTSMFGTSLSQKQVDGMEGILDAFATHGDGSPKTLAYSLATARGEVGPGMVPVREGFASTDVGARRAVNALARKRGPNSAVAKYAKPDPETGHVYYGRGHVQLTWKDNYRRSSADAGVDLVTNPDAMLDPVTSARVLIRGLMDGRWNGSGKGVRYYLDRGDITGARRTVNVQDKAETFAGYYRQFLAAIENAGGVPTLALEQEPQKPTEADFEAAFDEYENETETAPPASSGPNGGLFAALAAVFVTLSAYVGDKIDIIQKMTEWLQ